MTILEQRSFLQEEIERRKDDMGRLERDISVMKQIITTLEILQPPCNKCNGKGETVAFDDDGDPYFETCDKCGGRGTGKKPERS